MRLSRHTEERRSAKDILSSLSTIGQHLSKLDSNVMGKANPQTLLRILSSRIKHAEVWLAMKIALLSAERPFFWLGTLSFQNQLALSEEQVHVNAMYSGLNVYEVVKGVVEKLKITSVMRPIYKYQQGSTVAFNVTNVVDLQTAQRHRFGYLPNCELYSDPKGVLFADRAESKGCTLIPGTPIFGSPAVMAV